MRPQLKSVKRATALPGTVLKAALLFLGPRNTWVRFGSIKHRVSCNTVVYRAEPSKKNHQHSILALVSGTSRHPVETPQATGPKDWPGRSYSF